VTRLLTRILGILLVRWQGTCPARTRTGPLCDCRSWTWFVENCCSTNSLTYIRCAPQGYIASRLGCRRRTASNRLAAFSVTPRNFQEARSSVWRWRSHPPTGISKGTTMNRTLAAAAAAAIGFSISSLVAPAVAGAWPGTCLPFVGCIAVPVDPRGALPAFGGLPHGLPGMHGMPGMPAIAAPPPMIAPPVVPPPDIAPPVVPVAAPPVIAPPVVAPPVIPAAAPTSPMPNMEPLEHSVEGLLNAPAPAAPAAPSSPMPNMEPLEHSVEGLLNPPAAPAPAAPPVVEAAAPPAMAAPHIEAPAPAEAAAPVAPAAPEAPQQVVVPPGAESLRPEAQQICNVTGACGQGTPAAVAPGENPGDPLATANANALGGNPANAGAPASVAAPPNPVSQDLQNLENAGGTPAPASAPAPAPGASQDLQNLENGGAPSAATPDAAPAPSAPVTDAPATDTTPLAGINPGGDAANPHSMCLAAGTCPQFAPGGADAGTLTSVPAVGPQPANSYLDTYNDTYVSGPIPANPQDIPGYMPGSVPPTPGTYKPPLGATDQPAAVPDATPAPASAPAPVSTPAVPQFNDCVSEGICAAPDAMPSMPMMPNAMPDAGPAPDAAPPAPAPDAGPPAPDNAPPPDAVPPVPDPNAPPPQDPNALPPAIPPANIPMPDSPSPDTQAIINGANGAQTDQPNAPQVAAPLGPPTGDMFDKLFPKYNDPKPEQPPIVPIIPQTGPQPNNVPYDRPGGVPLRPVT